MNDNLTTALSFLLASDAAESLTRNLKPTTTVVAKVETVSRKVRAKVEPTTATVPSTDKVEPISMPLPAKGSLDAKGFILATRKAKTRDEIIVAIAGFVGYDNRRDFGSQEMEAKLAAQRAMRPTPVTSVPYQRTTVPSAAGYVAGMPDHQRRTLNDLLGREQLAAEKMAEHQKLARDEKLPLAERALNDGLAQVEKARLQQIREDLKRCA